MTHARVSLVAPRLDEKPWGGRRLIEYGLDLPENAPIGEALVTAGEAVISAGESEGKTLQDVVDADPSGRLGALASSAVSGKPIFPLLVKLIDAAENLSIQVHPDDAGASDAGKLGKTEAWYVLGAIEDGRLFLGLKDEVTHDEFMEHAHKLDGTSADDLRAVDAVPGITTIIPAGTVHALGAGVVVYEIQQPSDVTYRLDDWGRTDAQGNPREMHLEQGEAAMRIGLRPNRVPGIRLDVLGRRTILTACRYFALEKLEFLEGDEVGIGNAGTPNVMTLLSGSMSVGEHDLEPGNSAVIWPTDTPAIVRCDAAGLALRAWVPDLDADIIQPCLAIGASVSDIAALGGMTGDLEAAVEPYER